VDPPKIEAREEVVEVEEIVVEIVEEIVHGDPTGGMEVGRILAYYIKYLQSSALCILCPLPSAHCPLPSALCPQPSLIPSLCVHSFII
jgi:hypothetical protein